MFTFTYTVGSLLLGVSSACAAPPTLVDAALDLPEIFEEIPNEKLFSGRLVVRPIQAEPSLAKGMTRREYAARFEAAVNDILQLPVDRFVAETGEYLVLVPPGESENTIAKRLLETGNFEVVEPDWLVAPTACPNDSNFSQQWHHQKIGSCTAWNTELGSTAITVAIVDTGIRKTHVDLGRNRKDGYHVPSARWESAGGPIDDVNGHGTATTGVVAATSNNGLCVAGMAWNISFRPMRVTDDPAGFAQMADLLAAARVAADAGDKVVSISYSGVESSSVAATAAYVRTRGALLVWSAGNANTSLPASRADDVIVVGGTNSSDVKSGFSNYGPYVDLVAPAEGIVTTMRDADGAYGGWSGTSFSCPMVAGLCGLMWSRNPSLAPASIEAILRSTCVDLGTAGVDNVYGYGRINAAAAVAATPRLTTRYTLWASSVPETSSPANTVPWTNETWAALAPTCDDCNTTACQYATNSTNSNTTPLTAVDFANFILPAGQKIVRVEVEVSGRYNTNTAASIGFRAFAPGTLIDTGWRNSPAFTSGTLCAERLGASGDITSLAANWTPAMVNALQFQVRRQSGLSNNTLRVVAMKVVVTTAPI
jgi:Subtilase family